MLAYNQLETSHQKLCFCHKHSCKKFLTSHMKNFGVCCDKLSMKMSDVSLKISFSSRSKMLTATLNTGLSPSAFLPSCHERTVPSTSWWKSADINVMWPWYDTFWRNVNIIGMTCTHLDIFVVCRSLKCQQVIVATVSCVSIIKVGLLTFELALRAAVLSAQPLEERSHHFGAAEAFEACTNVFVVPLQSTDLQDSDKGNDGDRKGADGSEDNTKFMWMCLLCHKSKATAWSYSLLRWTTKMECRFQHEIHSMMFSRHRLRSVKGPFSAPPHLSKQQYNGNIWSWNEPLVSDSVAANKEKTGAVEEIWAVTVEMTAAKTSVKAACAAKTWERHRTFSCWMKSVADICYY